jgi:hypothetical protein
VWRCKSGQRARDARLPSALWRIVPAVVSVVLTLALALASTPDNAVAAPSSQCQAYNPQLCAVSQTTSTQPSSSLPFTGFDTLLLLAGAGVLVLSGMLVRWAVAPRPPDRDAP